MITLPIGRRIRRHLAVVFLAPLFGCSSSNGGGAASTVTPDASVFDDGGAVASSSATGGDAAAGGDDDAGGGLTIGTSADASIDAGATCTPLLYLLGQDTGSAPDLSQPINLYSFDPEGPTLKKVGPIPCIAASDELAGMTMSKCAPVSGGGCTAPLAVGDDGSAWVMTPYQPGATTSQKLFHVSLGDASCIGSAIAVNAGADQILGAAFQTTSANGRKLFVTVAATTSPTGEVRIGQLDTTSGAVTNVQTLAGAPADAHQATDWFQGGGLTSDPVTGYVWTIQFSDNFGETVDGISPACSGGDCSIDTASGDMTVNEGTPVEEQGSSDWPSQLAASSHPWAPVFTFYGAASTSNARAIFDLYFFTPGWWSGGSREVDQTTISVASPATVMLDLGANVFAAAAAPECPATVVPPPAPPVIVR